MSARLRRAVSIALLALMGLTAAYSANTFSLRERFVPPAAKATAQNGK